MDNKGKDILLSFVIPFYNSEETLKNCINSILLQKQSKFVEIVLINDGSTDKSIKVIKKINSKNPNIILHSNKKNMGVSTSRNIGLKKAKGKFIIFLDSDDQITKNSLGKIIKIILQNKENSFIFFNKFTSRIKSNTYFNHSIVKIKNTNNNINKLLINFTKQKNIYGNIYNYILNKKFLLNKKILFSKNVNFAEDQEFVAKILCFCKKFKFINNSFYIYNSGYGRLSSSMSLTSTKSCLEVIFNLIKLKKRLKEKNKKKYINTIIVKIFKQFIPRLLFLKEKDLLIISKYLKKNKNLLNELDYYFGNKRVFFNKKISNYKKKLIDIRKIVSEDMIKNFKLNKNSKIFSFCYNYYSLAYAKILRNKKHIFLGHLDNNHLLLNKNKTNEKIISPKKLVKRNKKYKNSVVIIITNQFKKNIRNITDQLIKLGIPNKQILSKIF